MTAWVDKIIWKSADGLGLEEHISKRQEIYQRQVRAVLRPLNTRFPEKDSSVFEPPIMRTYILRHMDVGPYGHTLYYEEDVS